MAPRRVPRPVLARQRTDANAARSSSEKSCGSSHAAKWPPLAALLKYMTVGYEKSTQLRGARKISSGNVVNATGTPAGGGAWPDAAASACARPLSQYDRARRRAGAGQPVHRDVVEDVVAVRLPVGSLLTNASEIFT